MKKYSELLDSDALDSEMAVNYIEERFSANVRETKHLPLKIDPYAEDYRRVKRNEAKVREYVESFGYTITLSEGKKKIIIIDRKVEK